MPQDEVAGTAKYSRQSHDCCLMTELNICQRIEWEAHCLIFVINGLSRLRSLSGWPRKDLASVGSTTSSSSSALPTPPCRACLACIHRVGVRLDGIANIRQSPLQRHPTASARPQTVLECVHLKDMNTGLGFVLVLPPRSTCLADLRPSTSLPQIPGQTSRIQSNCRERIMCWRLYPPAIPVPCRLLRMGPAGRAVGGRALRLRATAQFPV